MPESTELINWGHLTKYSEIVKDKIKKTNNDMIQFVSEASFVAGTNVELTVETGTIYYKHSSTGVLSTKGPASTYNAYHVAIVDVTPGEKYFYSGTVYNYNDQDSIIIVDEDDNILANYLRYTNRTTVSDYMFVTPDNADRVIVTSYDSDPVIKMSSPVSTVVGSLQSQVDTLSDTTTNNIASARSELLQAITDATSVSGTQVNLTVNTGVMWYVRNGTNQLASKTGTTYNAYYTASVNVNPGEQYFFSGISYNYNDQYNIIILDDNDAVIAYYIKYTEEQTEVEDYAFTIPSGASRIIITSYNSTPVLTMAGAIAPLVSELKSTSDEEKVKMESKVTPIAASVNSKYITLTGSLSQYTGYSISAPIYLLKDEIIRISGRNLSGMCVVAKAASENDTGANGYEPIYTLPSANSGTIGSNFIKYLTVYIPENGYYVVCSDADFKVVKMSAGVASLLAKNDYDIRQIKAKIDAKGTENLPSYYNTNNYLTNRESLIEDNILNAGSKSDSFIFISDVHYPSNNNQAGVIINDIVENTSVNKVFFGGDVIPAYAGAFSANDNSLTTIKKAIKTCNDVLRKELLGKCEYYQAKGNHDYTIRDSNSGTSGITLPAHAVSNIIMSKHDRSLIHTNESDPTACYYYVDSPSDKLRYIVLDTSDSAVAGNVGFKLVMGVGTTQFNWIASQAVLSTPNDYKIIFIAHVPVAKICSTGADYEDYDNINGLIAAIQSNGSYGGHNFSSFTPKVLAYISGHEHQDIVTYENNVLHYTIACDAKYNDYKKSPVETHFNFSLPTKTEGTIYEQTFDVLTVDISNNIIKSVRIGGGTDKVFHTNVVSLNVNDSTTLTPTISGNVQWWCYNNNTCTIDSSYNVTLSSTRGSISNGTFTATGTGDVVAVAYNGSSLEYFNISIS